MVVEEATPTGTPPEETPPAGPPAETAGAETTQTPETAVPEGAQPGPEVRPEETPAVAATAAPPASPPTSTAAVVPKTEEMEVSRPEGQAAVSRPEGQADGVSAPAAVNGWQTPRHERKKEGRKRRQQEARQNSGKEGQRSGPRGRGNGALPPIPGRPREGQRSGPRGRGIQRSPGDNALPPIPGRPRGLTLGDFPPLQRRVRPTTAPAPPRLAGADWSAVATGAGITRGAPAIRPRAPAAAMLQTPTPVIQPMPTPTVQPMQTVTPRRVSGEHGRGPAPSRGAPSAGPGELAVAPNSGSTDGAHGVCSSGAQAVEQPAQGQKKRKNDRRAGKRVQEQRRRRAAREQAFADQRAREASPHRETSPRRERSPPRRERSPRRDSLPRRERFRRRDRSPRRGEPRGQGTRMERCPMAGCNVGSVSDVPSHVYLHCPALFVPRTSDQRMYQRQMEHLHARRFMELFWIAHRMVGSASGVDGLVRLVNQKWRRTEEEVADIAPGTLEEMRGFIEEMGWDSPERITLFPEVNTPAALIDWRVLVFLHNYMEPGEFRSSCGFTAALSNEQWELRERDPFWRPLRQQGPMLGGDDRWGEDPSSSRRYPPPQRRQDAPRGKGKGKGKSAGAAVPARASDLSSASSHSRAGASRVPASAGAPPPSAGARSVEQPSRTAEQQPPPRPSPQPPRPDVAARPRPPRAYDSHFHLDRMQEDRAVTQRRPDFPITLEGGVINLCDPRRAQVKMNEYLGTPWGSLCHFAIGIHPKMATDALQDQHVLGEIETALTHPWVRGISEIGFDFSRRNLDQEGIADQERLFRWLLSHERRSELVLILHLRGGRGDGYDTAPTNRAFDILSEQLGADARTQRIHFHCFQGHRAIVERWRERFPECYFSIAGTPLPRLPRWAEKVDGIRAIPLNRLLLETDSPHLVPHSDMQRDTNTPDFVGDVGHQVAQIRRLPLERVLEQTKANAERLYGVVPPRPAAHR